MTKAKMLAIAQLYGVRAMSFGGCIRGSPIHPGQAAAMRRSAHAHNGRSYPDFGTICFKAHAPERVHPTLFWHEVGHIYRPSWTQAQCDRWAWHQVRSQGQ